MKKTLIAALLASTLLHAPAHAQTAPSTLSVTGEASVAVAPDLARISIGVTTLEASAKAAMDANSAAMSAMIARIKEQGVEAKDIRTSNLSLSPNWTQDPQTGQSSVDGYQASNTLDVTVRDIEALGGILDSGLSEGANTLNGVSFDLEDRTSAADEARRMAAQDARRKAEILAEASGVKLGKVLTINEGGRHAEPVYARAVAMAAAPVSVEAGQLDVSASVSVTFEITE